MNELSGKRIAVLVEDGFEDLELWYPVLRLREAKAQVDVIGTGSRVEYKGKYGLSCPAEKDVADVKAADYHGLIIPGGWAPDKLRRYQNVLDFVRSIFMSLKPVGAICHAPWVLISARVLAGKTMTSTVAVKDDIENAGANWVDQPVVVDANLVSSRRPADLPYFCRAFIAAFGQE